MGRIVRKKEFKLFAALILVWFLILLVVYILDEDDRTEEANYESEVSDTSNLFRGTRASEIAREFGIEPEDYFVVSPKVAEKITASGRFAKVDEPLADIYFPAVMMYREYIEQAAKEAEIPANVLAILATIESAGVVNAQSGADANGLVQVVPRYHFEKFIKYLPEGASLEDYNLAKAKKVSKVKLETYREVFNDPAINTKAGALYLKECIVAARKAFPALDANSIAIYGWAAAAYNGGIGNMKKGFEKMPAESQKYVDYMARIALDVEIALRLREEGMSPEDVLKSMQSDEMNARAYAYEQFRLKHKDDYDASVKAGASGLNNTEFKKYYDKFPNEYQCPLTPGLRLWVNSGGYALFSRSDVNNDWRLPE